MSPRPREDLDDELDELAELADLAMDDAFEDHAAEVRWLEGV